MPWQRHVIEVATEYDPETGIPSYREIVVTTPRRAGKTTLILAIMLHRCLAWGRHQSCVWTGQDGASIRKKWLNEIVPELERSQLAPAIRQVRRANGSEGIEWHGHGSRIDLLPTSETAGHGMTLDCVVMDEIFADRDNRREAALLPAMATKPDAQLLVCSTAGTAESHVYNRKVRAGRRAVEQDTGEGMAYFEWSAPDDWDPDDEDSWWTFMPALGHTITPAVVRMDRRTLEDEPGEFIRAYGNRPQLDSGDVIPDRVWRRVNDPDHAVASPLRVAIAAGPDRDVGAVAVADESTVELVEYKTGSLDWLLPRGLEIAERYGVPLVFDKRGPEAALSGLEDAGEGLMSNEVAAACGRFFDAVADGRVKVRQEPALDAAVRGLERHPIGDRFVWSRKGSRRDVTGLYAVTLAWGAETKPVESGAEGFALFMGGT